MNVGQLDIGFEFFPLPGWGPGCCGLNIYTVYILLIKNVTIQKSIAMKSTP